MTRFFCLVLMLFGLGACGSDNTPTLTTKLPEGNCGEIFLTGSPLRAMDAEAARSASACFAQAFQKCASTSLTIQEPNNVTRQFSIARNGATCALRQAFQADANSPPAVVDCKTARLENNTLVIEGCSHLGDFVLTP